MLAKDPAVQPQSTLPGGHHSRFCGYDTMLFRRRQAGFARNGPKAHHLQFALAESPRIKYNVQVYFAAMCRRTHHRLL
jgi:hypothetical protein